MLLSPAGTTADRHGLFATHRGRQVKIALILLATLLVVFTFVSNSLNPNPNRASASAQTEPASVASASTPEKEPGWAAIPHDAFSVNRKASLPSGFVGSDAYTSMLAAGTNTAIQIATYSSRQTPEEYVAGIQALSSQAKESALAKAQESWPALAEANITVKGVASGVDPVIRTYDAEAMTATLEVVVKQTLIEADGSKSTSTRTYLVYLQGAKQDDNTVAWGVSGYESR